MRLRSVVLSTASLGGIGSCKAQRIYTTSTYSATTTMAVCFSEAFVAKRENRISEQEYIGHLTAHLRGIRHEDDDLDNTRVGDQLHSISMFTSLFRVFALSNRTLSTEDTVIYDQLLLQCSAGDLDSTKSLFARLENDPSLPIPLQALAVLAARQGHAHILEFCFQKGAKMDKDVDISAGQTVDTAEMIELLWNKNWRDIQHSAKVQGGMVMRSIHRPVGMLEFLLRHRANVPLGLFRFPSIGQVSLPVMRALVRECGVDPLRGTGALTLAIQEGNRDLVEYLCELGLPINECPPEYDPREPGMCSPLYTAVKKRDASMMEYLLERGADPNAPFVEHSQTSVLQAVQQRNDEELLRLLEKYAAVQGPSQKI